MEKLHIAMPPHVEKIIDRLRQGGYEAYAVGGCVRDSLLGREPGDWDIATSARPEEVKRLFLRTVDTGIRHGTVTVLMEGTGYEVTTYRIDGEYEDGRHPKQVAFTSELVEDLRRRDFTINAMAYGPETGIVDAFDGRKDLKRRTIRCVGNAMERFGEDALRILRAIRFSAQLDFAIEEETYEAISRIAPNLAKVSKERIQVELTKLLCSDHPETIRKVYETGISRYISPAFAALPWQDFRMPEGLPPVKYVRWAAFLRLAGPDRAVQVLKDLKLDNDTISRVRTLSAWADSEIRPEAAAVRRAMSGMDPELWDVLTELNGYGMEIRRLTEEIRARGDCLDLRHLAVDGQDLIAAGVRPGRELGQILKKLLDQVLECPEKNEREALLDEVNRITFCNPGNKKLAGKKDI